MKLRSTILFAFIVLTVSCTKTIEEKSKDETTDVLMAKPPSSTSPLTVSYDWKQCLGANADENGVAVAKGTLGAYMSVGNIGSPSPVDGYFGLYNPATGLKVKGLIGGSRTEQIKGVVATDDGGFLVVGTTNSPENDGYNYPTKVNNAGYNYYPSKIFFTKFSGNGTKEWQKLYHEERSRTLLNVKQTKAGGIVVTGYESSAGFLIVFTPAIRTFLQEPTDAEISATFEWESAPIAYPTSTTNFPYAVVEESTGSFVVAGSTGAGSGTTGSLIARITRGQTPQTNKIFAADQPLLAFGIEISSTGFIVTGRTDDPLFVLKVNNDLTLDTKKYFGGSGTEQGRAITKTSQGYLIIGHTNSKDGDITNTIGSYDIWALHINENLEILPNRSFSLGGNRDDYGHYVILDIGKNGQEAYTIVGTTYSTGGDVSGKSGGCDIWTAKFQFPQ
ncbi:MAG TPA: hypothetical protein VF622_03350 [Segetibacter sp.]|jgi:hypothetical protein